MDDSPPPPYSARKASSISSSTEHGSQPIPQAAPVIDAVTQFRRYIVETMGFTSDVDFALLNHALGQTIPNTTTPPIKSILTLGERSELLRLAILTNELAAKAKTSRWILVPLSDRKAVTDAIVKPATYLKLSEEYILAIFST